jgi:hypothetical protein
MMLERAFVFEITAQPGWNVVGAGAVCVARREVALWRTGEEARLVTEIPARQWIRVGRELASSIPAGSLPATSAVHRMLARSFGWNSVRVQYLGIFPIDAVEWLPTFHPAAAVLAGWRQAVPADTTAR